MFSSDVLSLNHIVVVERIFLLFPVHRSHDVNLLGIRKLRESACAGERLQHVHLRQQRISARTVHLAQYVAPCWLLIAETITVNLRIGHELF